MSTGVTKLVEDMEGEYYTINQVASMVGRHPDTIKGWIKRGEVEAPKEKLETGSTFVWLYTPELVEEYQEYAAEIKIGRPPKDA